MRKSLVAFILVSVLLTACTKTRREIASMMTCEADSIAVDSDSLAALETDSQVPVEADELFDDFFFNYASNSRWQLERTAFPLVMIDEGRKWKISKRQWKTEKFFINQDYYTLIFDSPQQMELVRDTSVAEAVVERIDMDKARVQQFVFSRQSGRWMLHEVRWQQLPRNANAQFLQFYQHFVSDSTFQHQSLANQIQFSGPDPDDDFSMIEGVITPDFWDAFKPDLPAHTIYNIVYGHQNPASNYKIFLLRGIANGMEVELTFRLHRGRWKLTKLLT